MFDPHLAGYWGFADLDVASRTCLDVIAANAFTTTTLATAVASFVWPMAEWIFRGKPSVLGFCSGAVAGLVVRFIVLPSLPRLRDSQVALYLEEHEPTLDGSVVTAVEMRDGSIAMRGALRSPALIDRLTSGALDRVRGVSDGRRVDGEKLKINFMLLGAAAITAVVMSVFGPDAVRNGFRLLLMPWNAGAPASLFQPHNASRQSMRRVLPSFDRPTTCRFCELSRVHVSGGSSSSSFSPTGKAWATSSRSATARRLRTS